MSYNTKNFTAHGGEETVIGGKLTINGTLAVDENATVTGLSADPLTPATDEALGGVIVGDGLSIDDSGVLSVTNPLTAATADTLGGIKVGTGLSIASGVLSVTNPLTAATADTLGGIKVGTGLSIASGVLSVTNPLTAAENQDDSTATAIAELKTDFNALLAKLVAAGLMEEPAGD